MLTLACILSKLIFRGRIEHEAREWSVEQQSGENSKKQPESSHQYPDSIENFAQKPSSGDTIEKKETSSIKTSDTKDEVFIIAHSSVCFSTSQERSAEKRLSQEHRNKKFERPIKESFDGLQHRNDLVNISTHLHLEKQNDRKKGNLHIFDSISGKKTQEKGQTKKFKQHNIVLRHSYVKEARLMPATSESISQFNNLRFVPDHYDDNSDSSSSNESSGDDNDFVIITDLNEQPTVATQTDPPTAFLSQRTTFDHELLSYDMYLSGGAREMSSKNINTDLVFLSLNGKSKGQEVKQDSKNKK